MELNQPNDTQKLASWHSICFSHPFCKYIDTVDIVDIVNTHTYKYGNRRKPMKCKFTQWNGKHLFLRSILIIECLDSHLIVRFQYFINLFQRFFRYLLSILNFYCKSAKCMKCIEINMLNLTLMICYRICWYAWNV